MIIVGGGFWCLLKLISFWYKECGSHPLNPNDIFHFKK